MSYFQCEGGCGRLRGWRAGGGGGLLSEQDMQGGRTRWCERASHTGTRTGGGMGERGEGPEGIKHYRGEEREGGRAGSSLYAPKHKA